MGFIKEDWVIMRYGAEVDSKAARPAYHGQGQPAKRLHQHQVAKQTLRLQVFKVLKMFLPRNRHLFAKETRFPCASAEEHREGWGEDNDARWSETGIVQCTTPSKIARPR